MYRRLIPAAVFRGTKCIEVRAEEVVIQRDWGRFEPVSLSKWLDTNSINVPDMHGFDETGAGQALKTK